MGIKDHEIVFEDLRGAPDNESATVDLDGDDKGVRRYAVDDDDEPGKVEVNLDGDDAEVDDDPKPKPKGDEGDDEGDEYSKKVKARIKREQRQTAQERERAERWEREAVESRKQLAELKKRNYTSAIERADQELKSVEEALEAAHEAGETKVVVKLTSRLSDLKAEKIMAQSELTALEAEPEVTSTDSGKTSAERAKVRGDSKKAELVDGWMEEQDDWYGRKGFERHTRVANRIDKEVFRDGYDPGTAEYYEELTARIKAQLPDLFDEDTGTERSADRTQTRRGKSPVAPVRGAESSQTRKSSSRVELNEQDFENMRRFGLNTRDPDTLKEYARNKREAERSALDNRG